MPYYEHTFIARPDLTPQQAQALAEGFTQVVEELGGKVVKTEYWGLRSLQYRIKKHRKGHYLHLNIDGPSKVVDELERQERISEDILRWLTVRTETLEEGPSVMMQSRSGRDDRRR
ncbi:MAG TPA: 30S ribosomal protein S6 [Rhodospirillales bacterium]|nr:30S ribosomal protein S6 [Rhodospirillales bacterium]